MSKRRPMGSLEDDVMEYLWGVGDPASPADVRENVAPDLAYTTVNTVLVRLWEKERLARERRGRGYVYSAVDTEAEHRATEMATTLNEADDRSAVLSQFVDGLRPDDLGTLRSLIRRLR